MPSQLKLGDIDQLCEVLRGWETNPIQLSSGPLDLLLKTANAGNCSLLQLSIGPRISDSSVVHAGTIGFVLAERPQIWCGMQIKPPSLLVMSAGREMRSVLEPGFRSLEFYLSEEDIVAHRLGQTLDRYCSDPESSVIPLNQKSARQLHTLADAIYACSENTSDDCGTNLLTDAIQYRILDVLEHIIHSYRAGRPRQPGPCLGLPGFDLANEALEKIERSNLAKINVSYLCRHLGVSRRSLELAFSNTLGVAPGQYLLANRLHVARHSLATKGGHVSAAAEMAGFHDGSRFAFQYRRLFAELPSQTLARRQG